jgi:hypothetical protein
MFNLTPLAPDIIAAILDETLPKEVTFFELGRDSGALGGAVGEVSMKPG